MNPGEVLAPGSACLTDPYLSVLPGRSNLGDRANGRRSPRCANRRGQQPSAPTGHPTRFFNYSHYFFNQGGGGLAVLGAPGAYDPQFGVPTPLTAAFPPRNAPSLPPRAVR